ncbi:MAG: hypothetical protein RL186_1029, partial [Pseudomonadota bacterium]
KLVAFLAGCAALLPLPAFAQSIAQETPVYFGNLVVGGPSSVTMATNSDSRSSTGQVILLGQRPVQRGHIDITFTPGAQVLISYPSSIQLSGANAPIFTPVLDGSNIRTIPPSGVLTVYFGGTLTFSGPCPIGETFALISISVTPA